MIITLKGANFSQSNIGTLSTYSIRFNSNGITNVNTSVDRETNTGYTATITFKENYELNGTITVTMGGADITSTAVSGLNINITKVTGNVVITVPAKSTVVEPEEPEEPETPTMYTFTVTPTPSTATVTLTASGYTQSGNNITVPNGTTVSWSVSASGYTTQTGTYTITNSNYNLTVTLDAEAATTATLTVNPAPSGAAVKLYAKGYSQSGNSITVPNDGTVSPTYQVYKDNYLSQGGIVSKIKSSETLNITLQPFSTGNWTNISSTAEKVADYFVVDGSGKFNGPYSTWCHWILPATPGKKYRITATAGQSARLWGFYTDKPVSDGSVKPISVSSNNGMTVKIADEVVAPEGTVYLVVNNRINSGDTTAIIEVLD